ncbi:MAG: hypothetical protein C3F11_16535 [Methylocystaceae bacterium]|nr:MAG: hypothetical protein C3F11_16535 [Methylocystaceae bacterium]
MFETERAMSRAHANRFDARRVGADFGIVSKRVDTRSNIDRATKQDLEAWTITDWPKYIPVTSAEVDVIEAGLGDLFDQLFGPVRCRGRKRKIALFRDRPTAFPLFLQPHAAAAILRNESHAGMLESGAHTVDRRRIDLLRLTNASTHTTTRASLLHAPENRAAISANALPCLQIAYTRPQRW